MRDDCWGHPQVTTKEAISKLEAVIASKTSNRLDRLTFEWRDHKLTFDEFFQRVNEVACDRERMLASLEEIEVYGFEFPLDRAGKPLAWPDPDCPWEYVDAWNGSYGSLKEALTASRLWTATEDERELAFGQPLQPSED